MNLKSFIPLSTKLLSATKELDPVTDDSIMVFDIDGCLFFETDLIVKKREEHLRKMRGKYPFLTEKFLKDLKKSQGTSKKELLARGLTPNEVEQCGFPDIYKYIPKDLELRNALMAIPIKKYCLTNAFGEKARHILDAIGILECFEGVFCADGDLHNSEFISKPQKAAFDFVNSYLEIKEGTIIHFFDDGFENLQAAEEAGWKPYLVGRFRTIVEILQEEFVDSRD